jgi:hypothetical protein
MSRLEQSNTCYITRRDRVGVRVTQQTDVGEEPGSTLGRVTRLHNFTQLVQEEILDSSFQEATNIPKTVRFEVLTAATTKMN